MRAHFVFAIGAGTGLAVASAVFLLSQSRERARVKAEFIALKENLSRADQALQRESEALSAVRRDLQAIRDTTKPNIPNPQLPAPVPLTVQANSTIVDYLGAPVSAPAVLDPKYSAKELASVFQTLCEVLGIKVEKLAVDTTEFPFVVHGLVEKEKGGEFFRRIDAELRALPGYTYGGSVTGRSSSGSTYFALNMTPSSAYPREQSEAIRRRLMLRLQMAAAAWVDPAP